jgi:CBS domain-containing protein
MVAAATSVAALSDRIAHGDPAVAGRQATLLISASGRLAGLLTRGDIVQALQADATGKMTVLEAASTDLATVRPEETLHDAMVKMLKRDIGRLPVVERAPPHRVVGYLGRAEILAARLKLYEEEELRERGPLLAARKL